MPPKNKYKRRRNPSTPTLDSVQAKSAKVSKVSPNTSTMPIDIPKEPVLFDPMIIQSEVINALTHPDVRKILLDIFKSATADHDIKLDVTNTNLSALEKKVDDLTAIVNVQSEAIQKQTARIEELEQYGRRNGIRISGISEKETRGNSIPWMKEFAKKHLDLNIPNGAISRMHRVGKPGTVTEPLTRPRPILVKFTTYQGRREALFKNKHLRSSTNPDRLPNVYLTEDLSRQRARLDYLARKAYKLNKIDGSWTADGTILTDLKGTVNRWTDELLLIEYLDNLPIRAKKSTAAAPTSVLDTSLAEPGT